MPLPRPLRLYVMQLDLADNYFELFGVAAGFRVDPAHIESRYRELQSLLHPDRHAVAGAQQKRLAAQGAALVNRAYTVLTDDCTRAAYLLELKGVRFDPASGTMHDQDFLMEQMELREALEQSDVAEDKSGALRGLETQVSERVVELSENFNEAYLSGKLDDARNIVCRMQFIRKFHGEVADRLHRVSLSPVESAGR